VPKPAIRIDTDALRMLRKREGVTQKALAERAGLSPSQVSRIEGGKVDPLYSTLCALAQALHMPADILVDEAGEQIYRDLVVEESMAKDERKDLASIQAYYLELVASFSGPESWRQVLVDSYKREVAELAIDDA